MNGKKIKIALCLSGEPRSSMASFPYIYETFLRNNSIYQTDIYIHSLKGFRALDSYQPKKHHVEVNNDFTKQSINFLLNIDPYVQKLAHSHTQLFTPFSSTLTNQYWMFRGINKCFNLITESYDVYIRLRPDIIFNSKFFLESILYDILENKYDIFVPYEHPSIFKKEEYNDQFAIGNFKSLKTYSELFNNMPLLVQKTNSLNTQVWLKYWLDSNNMKVNRSYIDYKLIRQSNIITNDETYNNFLDQ